MRRLVRPLVATFVLLFAGVASAQETTGTLEGRVVDAQGLAVPGVTVMVTGPQGVRTLVTDSEGRFSAALLTPGVYSVRAELMGFKATQASDLSVSLGQTRTVNLRMEVGGLTETVEVTGAASTVDVSATTTGAVLSSEMLARIPVGRRVTDTLYVAPGVSSSGSVGRANPSVSGSTGLDNQYVVDGVNVTNAGYGAIGSYSIVFGSLGSATPYDFVQEVQVKTGGYEAEFGQSMGGVVNVVTKSGSNQFRGSLFGYTRPDFLEAAYKTVQTDNGTVNTVGQGTSDAGVELGFPILEDRLFMFGAINPSWESRTFIAPEGFPLESLGEADRNRRLLSYAAKATWQPASAHRLDLSFFGDPSRGEMGPQRTSSLLVQDTSSFSEIDYGGHNQTVRYDAIVRNNWLVEAAFARAKNIIEELPSVDEWRVTDTTVTPQVRSGGIGFYEAGNDSESLQYSVKSTHVLPDHEIKYGALYEDVAFSQLQQRTGPPIVAHDGRTTATGANVDIIPDIRFGQIYRVIRANFNDVRDTHQDYFSAFVQDSWQATDRLTVNAGLRYEQETLIGTFEQLPTLDGRFLDDFTLKNNWAPRIGAVYDVLGGGRSRLFANYGRFFARVPNDLAARILSSDEAITRGDYFDAALTQPIPDGVITETPTGVIATQHFIAPGGGEAHTFIDPDARLSFKDEYVAGFEWQAMPNTTLGIRYIHRNIGRALEDVGLYPVVACDLGSEGACNFDTYVMTNPDENTQVILDAPGLAGAPISFEKPIHNYNAVELTMDRRVADNWSMMASYRWSRLHGTYEGFFREDNGQSDPAITSLYDFPTNDPTYTSVGGALFGWPGDIRYLGELGAGPLPLDRPHNVKVFGQYLFDAGVNIGLGFTAISGKPLTALAGHPTYGNDSEIPVTPRGAGFETVDGFRERTPAEYQVDMQASYSLALPDNRRVTFIADAFNLFNLRRVTDYNAAIEYPSFGVINPDFGTPTSANVAGQFFQTPFQLRLGARFEF
jgi:outer membrane receptor protein involved in Fe transport